MELIMSRTSRFLALIVTSGSRFVHCTGHAHSITPGRYKFPPSHLTLTNVVVIHRHGDRSQISKEIGPKYPETSRIKDIWDSKLPSPKSMIAMASAAHISPDLLISSDLKDILFMGWDSKNIPYGQLTELGSNQLIAVGKELRYRYIGTILPEDYSDLSSILYCRSTNFCRTVQSLRSLLSGLIHANTDDTDGGSYTNIANIGDEKRSLLLPTISYKTKDKETMFPCADGPCLAMTERRTEIFANNLMEKSIENYLELEGRMKELLGYTDRVSWMTIKEILTCYESHGIPFPEGITSDDAERVTRLSGWYLGAMYQDDKLNQLGIGRFLRELLDVLHPAVHNLSTSSSPSFMIYSGHDATLVPILCALGLYDGIWPPYASFLTLEILHLSTDPSIKYVRAVYNDDEKVIVGSDSFYCPYDIFFERLNSLSISDSEYSEIRSRGLVVKEDCDDEKNAALLLSQQAVDDDMKATMANEK